MPKILVVEDNTFYREALTQSMIANFPSAQIEEAATGEEARVKFDWFRPDLTFMDIRLPDGTGLELTREIKDKYPTAQVAVLTSHDSPEYRETALKCGANCFLVKGVATVEDILSLIRSQVYP